MCAVQRAVAFGATVLARRETVDSRVLATSRQSRDCLRVAVLRDSPRFRGFRSAAAPIATAHATLVAFVASLGLSVSFPFRVLPLPRFCLAICGAMLRRRNTAFLASLASGGQSREPRQSGVTQLDAQALAPLLTSLKVRLSSQRQRRRFAPPWPRRGVRGRAR